MFGIWNFLDMFGIRNVRDVGCLAGVFEIFRTWNVRDVRRLEYRIFRRWDVWHVECLGCESFGCEVFALGCEMFRMWNVADV